MSREGFEKLPEIANLIRDYKAFYCNKGDWYLCPDASDFVVENYLDGAWYAYQEQQKKIDEVWKYISCNVKDGNIYDAVEEILE